MWVVTEAGKRMPLDADPVTGAPQVTPQGNLLVIGHDAQGIAVVRHASGGDHLSHFATCPQSKAWRKP